MNSTFLINNLHWFALALVSGGLLIWPKLKGMGRGVTPSQAVTLINRQNAVIVDIRNKDEFDTGHLPNALNIPLADLEKRVGELKKYKSRPILLVCKTGIRANAAEGILRKAEFEQPVVLTGGVDTWRQEGQPLSQGTQKA